MKQKQEENSIPASRFSFRQVSTKQRSLVAIDQGCQRCQQCLLRRWLPLAASTGPVTPVSSKRRENNACL